MARTGVSASHETWLAEVAGAGWVELFKDYAIMRWPAQIAAVKAGGLRCFCLTRADLRGADQVRWFLANSARTQRAALKAGPYIYGVYEDKLDMRRPLDPATKRTSTP